MRAQKVSTHSGTGPPVPDHVKRPPAAGGVAGVASNMPGLSSSTERRRSVELDLNKKVSRDKRMLEVLNSRVGLPNAKAEDGKEWLGGPGDELSASALRISLERLSRRPSLERKSSELRSPPSLGGSARTSRRSSLERHSPPLLGGSARTSPSGSARTSFDSSERRPGALAALAAAGAAQRLSRRSSLERQSSELRSPPSLGGSARTSPSGSARTSFDSSERRPGALAALAAAGAAQRLSRRSSLERQSSELRSPPSLGGSARTSPSGSARTSFDSSERRPGALKTLAAAGAAAAGVGDSDTDRLSAKAPSMKGLASWRQSVARVRRLSVASIQKAPSPKAAAASAAGAGGDGADMASSPVRNPGAHGYAAPGEGPPTGARRSVESISYDRSDETLHSTLEGSVAGGRIGLSCAVVSRRGQEAHSWKKNNQDAYLVECDGAAALVGAFDGHGSNGHAVSAFVRDYLRGRVVELCGGDGLAHEWEPTVTSLFAQCDQELKRSTIQQLDVSGTTAVIAALHDNLLHLAWVGDSRAMVVRKGAEGGRAVAYVTEDHKPDSLEERQRIVSNNGRVDHLVDEQGRRVGPPRVFLRFAWTPGLSTSRAFGDMLAHEVGVVAQPDCHTIALTGDEEYVLLASDGVWEFMDEQAVIDAIAGEGSLEGAADAVVAEARKRWNEEEEVVDDITAVILKLGFSDDFKEWAGRAPDGGARVAAGGAGVVGARLSALKLGERSDAQGSPTASRPAQPGSPIWSELKRNRRSAPAGGE